MAATSTTSAGDEKITLGGASTPLITLFAGIGIIALAASAVLGYFADPSLKYFFFAYLVGFCYVLSLSLGGMFFVLIQFVTKAGWSVTVRRVAEWFASSIPLVAVLALPLLAMVLMHNGLVYMWSDPKWGQPTGQPEAATAVMSTPAADSTSATAAPNVPHVDSAGPSGKHVSPSKRAYLSPVGFSIRVVIYFLAWIAITSWYWRSSTLQDRTGEWRLTDQMQFWSAPSLVISAITVTLAAFDFIMSLDPYWASTIFGVYFFAGSMVSFFAAASCILILLKDAGYLSRSLSREHYHDMGKFLFAFVFFWGYIAFSQFMLIWYGNIPEETEWFRRRGATTAQIPLDSTNGYSWVILAILFGHLLIPFAGLLSRHVKRSSQGLGVWAAWLLIFHYVDLYWLIMPEYSTKLHAPVVELLAVVGMLGLFLAMVFYRASSASLRPVHDPRLPEALAFQNI